jgi:hypothetical protein
MSRNYGVEKVFKDIKLDRQRGCLKMFWWLWLVIIAIVSILLYFIITFIKEIAIGITIIVVGSFIYSYIEIIYKKYKQKNG